jgi:hypothetical protein
MVSLISWRLYGQSPFRLGSGKGLRKPVRRAFAFTEAQFAFADPRALVPVVSHSSSESGITALASRVVLTCVPTAKESFHLWRRLPGEGKRIYDHPKIKYTDEPLGIEGHP